MVRYDPEEQDSTSFRITGETFDEWSDTEYRMRCSCAGGGKVGPFDVQQFIDMGILNEEEIGKARWEDEKITITIDFI